MLALLYETMLMSLDRSDTAYDAWRESAEKLDYFMAGLCSALTAYVGQTFVPEPLGINPTTLTLVALGCFAASVVAAFRRIEYSVHTLYMMHRRLYHEEAAGNMVAASQLGVALNKATGEVVGAANLLAGAEKHSSAVPIAKAAVDAAASKAERQYKWRNGLLYLGFALYVASRIWRAYL